MGLAAAAAGSPAVLATGIANERSAAQLEGARICVTSVRLPAVTLPSLMLPTTSLPATVLPTTTLPSVTIPPVTVGGRTIPGRTIPGRVIPGRTIPGRTIPGRLIPGRTIPGRTLQGYCLSLSGGTATLQTSGQTSSLPAAFAPPHLQTRIRNYASLDSYFSQSLTSRYWSTARSTISIPDVGAAGFGEFNAAGFPKNQYVRSYVRSDQTVVSGYWRNSSSDGLPTCRVISC